MRVRVKRDSKVLNVTAFGGFQYIRSEWREVPAGCEQEAEKHPYLEIEPLAKAEGKPSAEGRAVETTAAPKPPTSTATAPKAKTKAGKG
jgi:hypothetical protein